MLSELTHLLEAITEESANSKNVHARLATLLALEVRARLELEAELIEYLDDAGKNPFAAAVKLREFLIADRRSEGTNGY